MKSCDLRGYVPFILVAILFGVYLKTICPEIYPGDSGEFTAAAFCLGIPHNSGYPLYALLGKLFCLIPLGNVAFRMNLLSTCFAVLAAWLVYSLIFRMTSSRVSAFASSLFLAFTPAMWLQTVCAEVYTLHAFFVVLLMRLLWEWDEKRDLPRLLVFVFVTGVSFGNHMQTVMLAPPVLFIILSGDRRALFSLKHLALISCFFAVPLLLYLYLPVRTNAGAAIHWGDPNTLKGFLAHVTASAHREAYILTRGGWDYLARAKEVAWFVYEQFGAFLLLAVWGWLKLSSVRWRIFFAGIILFDFVYTVFLNIISLDVTAFNIPTFIVLSVLGGAGIADILRVCESRYRVGRGVQKIIRAAFCAVPAVPLLLNFGLCNQGRNYTAYDHALNIFRTLGHGSTLFIDGDNNLFPVTYGRVVEGMREDVTLYDRYNLFFRMPYLGENREAFAFRGKWEELRALLEKGIIEKAADRGVFFAVFNPRVVSVPAGYTLAPFGILNQVIGSPSDFDGQGADRIWNYYSTVSFQDDFERDYLNRQLCAHFYFSSGRYHILKGRTDLGLRLIESASRIGYNDRMIHSEMALFLTDHGFPEAAREELEKALVYHEDMGAIHNIWGYYYHRLGDYEKAAESFRRAIDRSPGNHTYYNNLGLALREGGRRNEAALVFRKSLSLHGNQPEIERLLRGGGP